MTLKTSFRSGLAGVALAATSAGLAFAQATAEAPAAAVPNKGDTTWMLLSTILVLLMVMPGLALFYGGLTRSKNMLSVLSQVTATVALMCIVWVVYGYSLAFTSGGSMTSFIGGFSKSFLAGVGPESTSDTFTKGVVIPEYVFICFQMTFAMITPALIIGGFVERMKFSAMLLFVLLWSTFVYFPIAHMVWHSEGYLFTLGALDFAGGTVVHINAGIAALVGCLLIGKRIGYGKELMSPHSLTMTYIGTALLWVGWFGFNAGSNLEATGTAALAMINTFTATAGAALGWLFIEWMVKGKPSLLGMLSGIIAGLVAVTPAAGLIGPMGAIVLGAISGVVCFFFCTSIKNALGYDDSLDVFGIHGVGGIIGSIGTGIFVAPALGGVGVADYAMGAQVWKQFVAVVIAIVWCGVGSLILFKIVDVVVGLRVAPDAEREGLDIAEHGERAYHA
ncbi:ammonium transporter [Bosea sp. (in: a-proteobacteria)]|uniref:ammonium transporter n=1 Tax=Bosea sp. (in: a-proteobacteria) TaxID=1871050 RepID=UPI0027335B06|nr:ammonium transporter [Bosea sp. (in: a-proteobacteria)]MDP3257057.1 ammonium transporter [Bosea sp. (in: a-proteobacteria)]